MAKSSNNSMNPKIIAIILIIAAFGTGYLIAWNIYKPQINELTKLASEKASEATKIKTSANKVMMKDGVVWLVDEGIADELDVDLMLSNGDRIMMDGTIKKDDGAMSKMEEGDILDMNGQKVKE